MLLLGVVKEGIFFCFVKNGYPITKFTWIESPFCVDTQGLTNAILCIIKLNQSNQDLEKYSESVFKHLVEVNFNGVSVISSHIMGVPAWLKEHRDRLLHSHCVAHLLVLAVLDAIKFENAFLAQVKNILNRIFEYYCKSAVRRNELEFIADMFQKEVKKLGLMKKNCWVASHTVVLNLIESNYQILVYNLVQTYRKSKTAKKTLGFINFLKQLDFCFIYLSSCYCFVTSVIEVSAR